MKKFFSKMPLICLLAMVCGVFAGCDQTKSGKFSVSVKEVGSSYVDLQFTGPEAIEIAYILDTKEEIKNNPNIIFNEGVEATVSGGDVLRITNGIDEDTQYYLYLVAKLDAQTFSEIYTLPFKTTKFEFDQLATVIDRNYDGYRMRLTLPESTKEAGNAIRWNQCCVMMYNYMASSDDYFSLLYNAGHYTTEDVTLVYSEDENWYETGQDSDGDGEVDWDVHYNPISPGEPVVFVAGEFSWMEDSPEYETEYFKFPAGWEDGYYIPLIDTDYFSAAKEQSSVGLIEGVDMSRPLDDYWTGAFQRKFFHVKQPDVLEAKVNVELESVTPANATLNFFPEDGVDQFAFGVFDESLYEQLLELCMGNEDYLQWAVTSYFAAYTFGTKVAKEAVQANLTTFYYQDAITPETKYIVLVTAMGDPQGTSQSFTKFEFETTAKVKDAPTVEVTALDAETTPYAAAFNIKCTSYQDNPLTEAYYAANYLRDWLLAINGGSTYFNLVKGNYMFSEEELAAINSEEGFTMKIPSVDGETTRLVVVGFNDEYTPNDVTSYKFIEECPAVADCTTPYTDPKPYIDPSLYTDLAGVWTATATLTDAQGKNPSDYSSKIVLAADMYDYPETLDQKVYDIYEEEDFDKEEVDAMWYEFKALAQEITEERLENQNRLVGMGWLDKDSYDRLSYRTPYDLFIATDYASVDVSSLYNDFGPKWYLEATKNEDGSISYSIPIDSNFLPPASNWSIPFYLGGMQKDTWYTILNGEGWTPAFPVTVSADRNTIIISPLEYGKEDPVKLYPNMIGIDPMYGTILENPVVSEIVLTRGWEGDDNKEQSAVRRGASKSVQAQGEFPTAVYKQRTRLSAPAELKKIDYKMVSMDEFHENAKKFIEKRYANQNN